MFESLFESHVDDVCATYDAALDAASYDAVAVYSGALHIQFLDDNAYPFKASPLFKHWLPLDEHPDCFVLYRPGAKPTLVYYQPDDYWHRPPDDPSGFWTAPFDIKVVDSADAARALLPKGRVALLGESQERFDDWGFAATNPEAVLNPLHYRRAWKSDYEIACMAEASRIGVAGHVAAKKAFAAGASEYDIHIAYCQACRQSDDGLPYSNIIALNNHGAILHYTHRETAPPTTKRSFLIDAGGSFNGYASDITRTYSAGNDRFADMIEAMDQLQRNLCAQLRPGLHYPALHLETHQRIAQLLVDFDVLNVTAPDAVASGLSGRFYPHGLGHLIGLQVHDAGGFMDDPSGTRAEPPDGHPFLRLTRRIDNGHVMTIEPGVYFIESLLEPIRGTALGRGVNWATVDEYYPYGGIRIEDNVLVNDDTPRNLTREAFAAAG